jgi:soluble lytic murein transglycosylase
MKRLLCALLLASSASAALPATGDDRVLAARDAFRAGDSQRLTKHAAATRGHDLEPWVEYWQLSLRLNDAEPELLRDFLSRQQGSYLAEKLRGEWLKVLARRQQWDLFDSEYPKLAQPDQELVCDGLRSRLRLPDPSALEEARPLWFSSLELAESCASLMERLVASGSLGVEDVWERTRRLLEAKKLTAAKATAAFLPAHQVPEARMVDAIADKPMRHLALLPANFAATRRGREMALFAMQRVARNDPLQAAVQWEKIKDRFSAEERGYIHGQLAWQAAQRHLPEAVAWYELAAGTPLSEEQLAWKARAALRAQNWRMVHDAVEQMPAQMAARPDWIYWLGRAHAALGRRDEARALFQRIAGQPNFYGNLADDELGQPIDVPPGATRATAEELASVAADAGIRRALALFRLDMRIEAIREWNWSLRGTEDRRLLAAAELAQQNEVFDRAIYSADRTLAQHNYALRYLAPFREHVEPKARELQLDHAWVYGLMRQESRFITNAKSVVGAKGLMQLMPKTAQWVARKIGLKDFSPARVNDTEINVTLGTNYLKLVLDDLDNHPVLASAAYNAGPGRARRWRDLKPLEGAIYAETIPFNETRDYVKKVMSNSVYYSALFDGKPQSIKSRLGVVGARNGATPKIDDLP